MHVRFLAAVLMLALAPALAAAAPNPPPPAIVKLTDAIARTLATDDPSLLAGIFTDDAVIIDENAPFVWRGPGAAAAWWRVVDTVMKQAKLPHPKATGLRFGEFVQSPTAAYLVQAMTIAGTADGKPFAEPGTMTYTFRKEGGKWLISGLVWSTKP